MSGWYYREEGFIGDKNKGPLTDEQFLQGAFDGAFKLKTLVMSPQHTRGEWVYLESIPAARAQVGKGHAERQRLAEEEESRRQAMRQAEAQARAEADKHAMEQRVAAEQRIAAANAGFTSDGQPPYVIDALVTRLSQLLTSKETLQYIAVQQKWVAWFPDAIALTNRRVIIFRPKLLGKMDMEDMIWLNVADVHVSEGILFSTLIFSWTNGYASKVEYLPKAQSLRVYRIAQEREEYMMELRRERDLEQIRAGAGNFVVNTPAVAPAAGPATPAASMDDPLVKIEKLKSMLDRGLIDQAEYDMTKRRILESM